MIRTCKHCEDEFDCQSAEKQRVGGYINECPDCVEERVLKPMYGTGVWLVASLSKPVYPYYLLIAIRTQIIIRRSGKPIVVGTTNARVGLTILNSRPLL